MNESDKVKDDYVPEEIVVAKAPKKPKKPPSDDSLFNIRLLGENLSARIKALETLNSTEDIEHWSRKMYSWPEQLRRNIIISLFDDMQIEWVEVLHKLDYSKNTDYNANMIEKAYFVLKDCISQLRPLGVPETFIKQHLLLKENLDVNIPFLLRIWNFCKINSDFKSDLQIQPNETIAKIQALKYIDEEDVDDFIMIYTPATDKTPKLSRIDYKLTLEENYIVLRCSMEVKNMNTSNLMQQKLLSDYPMDSFQKMDDLKPIPELIRVLCFNPQFSKEENVLFMTTFQEHLKANSDDLHSYLNSHFHIFLPFIEDTAKALANRYNYLRHNQLFNQPIFIQKHVDITKPFEKQKPLLNKFRAIFATLQKAFPNIDNKFLENHFNPTMDISKHVIDLENYYYMFKMFSMEFSGSLSKSTIEHGIEMKQSHGYNRSKLLNLVNGTNGFECLGKKRSLEEQDTSIPSKQARTS